MKSGSYKLSGLNVRTFNGKKYLSIARDNFTVIKIDDIGEVKEDTSDLEVQCRMTGVKIVGVKFLDVYSGCYACKGKVTAISDILGDCDRCGVTQKVEQCKMYNSARMDLESEGTIKTLSAFSPITEEICQGSVSKVSLLMSEPFHLIYSANNVITSISR